MKVSLNKDNKMDYENELDFCEYNPMSVELEKEIRDLARVVETPAKCLFQKMIEKITLSHAIAEV